jgi:hypothetical protein
MAPGQPRPSLFTKQMILNTVSTILETTVGGQLPATVSKEDS